MALDETDDPLTGHFGGSSEPAPVATHKPEEDDPLTGHFGSGYASGVTPYTPAPDWHASDLPKGLEAGFHTGIGAPLAEVTGQTEQAASERERAKQLTAGMTPGAEQTWPVFIAEQAAPTVATLAPLAIPGVGVGISGGVAATLGAGSAISGNKEAIEGSDDETLKANNPEYAIDRSSGLTEEQAKAKLGAATALSVGVPSAIIQGAAAMVPGLELTGAFKLGVGAAENAALTGGNFLTKPVTGRVGQAIAGAGRAGVEMGTAGAAQEAVSKHAQAEEGAGSEATGSELLTAGTGQGLFGATMGMLGGAWHGGPHGDPITGKSAAPKAGESNMTRSGTEYRKPAAQVATPVDINTPPENKVAVAPTAANKGVGPDETVALNPGAVTQGVTKPPAETVIPPKVVQPKEPPPTINREAPPAGDTTSPPPIPPKVADASPTPVSAPPVEDTAAIVPETDATRQAQHAALLDPANGRDAMLYDKGAQPIELTDRTRFGQVKLKDGRVVQYDKQTPKGLTDAKIRQYAKDDRLNEALQLGDTPKSEALAATTPENPSTVVTERTQEGVPVKDAVGTAATAPDQAAALEAAKTPGSTIEVRSPEAALAERQAGVAQEQAVQPQVVEPVTPRVTQTPFGPGRVLEDTSSEGIKARDAAAADDALKAQTVAEQLRAKEAAKQAAAAEDAGTKAEAKRLHSAKADQEKVAQANAAAAKIVADHPHTGSYADADAVRARAKAMARAAGVEGIDVPKAFPEGHPWNAAMLKLREAKDLLAPIKKELGETREEKLGRFIDREHMIDTGRMGEALEARRAEGARGLGSPEGAVETVAPKGGAADEEGRSEEREGVSTEERPEELTGGHEDHEERPPDALAVAREERERNIAARRAESEALRKEAPAPKAAMGFKQEVRKSRAIKRRDFDEEGDKTVLARDNDNNPVAVNPQRTITAREAIDELHNPKGYTKAGRALNERLIPQLLKLAGDTPVHFISDADMRSLGAEGHGLYDPVHDHILLNADHPHPNVVLHELFHAATTKAFGENPDLRDMMDSLQKEMGIKGDSEEFLTRLMTEADMQARFKDTKISPELAKELGIPAWRKMTAWEGALHVIRQALGLGPRDISALEAAMSISEQAMWRHPEGVGDLMEAQGRANLPSGQETPKVSLPKLKWRETDPPEEQAHGMASDAQAAADRTPAFWKNEYAQATASGIKEKVFKTYITTAPTDALRIDNEHLYGDKTEANPMRRAQEGLLKQGHMIENMIREHDDLMQRMADMKRANPDGLERAMSILSEAHDFNIHPDYELGEGLNDYIKANPKTGEFDVKSNRPYHEAILAHERISKDFLDSTPEEQKLIKDVRDTLMEEGQRSVKANIEAFTQGVRTNFERNEKLQEAIKTPEANRTPSEIKQVERYKAVSKVLDGEALAEGDEHETYINDPHIKTLRDLRGMLKQEGPHFPGTRKGGWVVNAEHELPEAPNAVSVKGNEVIFKTEAEAHAYRKELVDRSLPSELETVREPISSDQKPGQGGDQYRVTVQNKHSSAANSTFEARKLGEALRKIKGIKPESVTEPMLRERNDSVDYGLHTGSLRAMDHAVDALTYLTDAEKANLKEANEQAALGLMKGNRMNSGLLKSNRVRGANADPVLALHDYIANSARSRARSKSMPDIDAAFKEMRDVNRNVQDANTPRRGMVTAEMEKRAGIFGKDGFTGQMSPTLQRITSLAYLKDMMAPIHFALDLTHQYLQSIPHMAGRHGFAAAHAMNAKTMSDMGAGSVLGKGIKGMFNAMKGDKPTDLMTGIRESLEKNGATAGDLKAFDAGRETPHLGSIITDFSKSFDRTGGLDRGMQYLQGVGNEMSHAVDAINRVATYMSAYRLERQKMGKAETLAQEVAHHAQAVRYAKDTVSQTQGIHSAANRASFLKNPAMRAAMQFRSIPMMIYRLLAKNAYLAVKGESREVRQAAVISLVSTMGTTAALAGATAGVPEPIRLAVEMGHALGINNSWEEYQDAARRYTDKHMGRFGSRLVMDGVLGAAGLNAGNRIGLQDLMIKDQALASPKDFALQMAGSPFGYGVNDMEGVSNILAGDYKRGIPKLLPIRLASDVAKAYIENQGGKQAGHGQPDMKPLDPYETFIKAMGGTPTREALYGQETSLLKNVAAGKKAALQKAVEGDHTAVRTWNKEHPHSPITQAQVLRGRQTKKIETPKQKQIEKDYHVYQ